MIWIDTMSIGVRRGHGPAMPAVFHALQNNLVRKCQADGLRPQRVVRAMRETRSATLAFSIKFELEAGDPAGTSEWFDSLQITWLDGPVDVEPATGG